jgi:hypothetical protein
MHQLILTTEEGDALRTFDGKTVVPLDAESANDREWLVTTPGGTQYGIVDDNDTWTRMRYARGTEQWVETSIDVDTFLSSHRLILAHEPPEGDDHVPAM